MWGALIGSNRRSFFQDQCEGRLLTQKILIQVSCEISKHHKLLQVGDSNMSFNVGGMPSEKIILV